MKHLEYPLDDNTLIYGSLRKNGPVYEVYDFEVIVKVAGEWESVVLLDSVAERHLKERFKDWATADLELGAS